jgi:hypothetical protein
MAARQRQLAHLRRRFHAFGDDRQAEGAGQCDDRLDDPVGWSTGSCRSQPKDE